MRSSFITAITTACLIIASSLYAKEPDRFELGFHIGICKTLLENFRSGNRDISNFQFYITNLKGVRIATFNLEKSVIRLRELFQNEKGDSRDKINKFLELIEKYKTGDIKAKEISIFNSIYYFLIYKSKLDSIKYGYLTSQMYTSVIFIKTEGIQESIKKNAYTVLWNSIDRLLLFSPYLFTSKNSDDLYMALINRDIKRITSIAILIIVNRLNIKLKNDPIM